MISSAAIPDVTRRSCSACDTPIEVINLCYQKKPLQGEEQTFSLSSLYHSISKDQTDGERQRKTPEIVISKFGGYLILALTTDQP